MKQRFFTLLLLIGLQTAMAGTTGKIAGLVQDKMSGEPLVGVNIYLENTVLGATTDVNGDYVILNIPPGKYTVIAQYIGYHEVKVEGVRISIDRTTTLNFELSEETMELESAIVVQAQRDLIQKDLTSSKAVVSSEQIESLPVVEMSDVLQLQPGVSRGANGEFHIRGGRSSEIAYQVNGVSISDAYDGSQAVDIDNNSIQEIEVISGTFPAEYGNAMSGVVNAVTKEGSQTFEGNMQIFTGDYLSNFTDYFYNIDNFNPVQDYSLRGSLSGPIAHNLTFFLTTRYNYTDGYLYGSRKFSVTGDTLVARRPDGSFEDGTVVPMNWSKNWTGQGKLTYTPTGTLKLTSEFLFSRRNFQDYDHNLKFAPDGNLNKFLDSYNGWLSMTHTLSTTTFYEVKTALLIKRFEQYLYESPTDPRYLDPSGHVVGENVVPWRADGNAFATGGTNNSRFSRETRTFQVRADLVSQMNKNHLVKMGVETRLHRLTLDGYSVQDGALNDKDLFLPTVPDKNSAQRSSYVRKPREFAGYIQDKIEYKDLTINVGVRLDYFDPNAKVPAIQSDPDINDPINAAYDSVSYAERESVYLKDATPKWQLSPRLGISYPINSEGTIHFSYGHFLQVPSFEYLYNRSDYRLPDNPNNEGVFGNADLDAQRTIMYEMGMQQGFATDFRVDVTGFYRDVRDWISTSAPIRTLNNGTYIKYINKDYSNIKGLTFSFNKRYSDNYSFDLSYTFQIAEGSNSSPEDEFNAINSGAAPTIFILPLDWDQRHLLNLSFYYGKENWGSSVIARYGSGLPYTPAITQVTSDRGISAGLQRNSREKPGQFTVDLRLHYTFELANARLTAFLRVFNLLDNRVVVNVFGDTGKADFTTNYNNVTTNGPNTVQEYIRFPWHYAPPRRVQFGLEMAL